MSGAQQVTFMNQRSFVPPGPPPPGAIGSAYEGGFYAGDISTTENGVITHYLVVGPKATAQDGSKAWSTGGTGNVPVPSDIDGPQNTADMVAAGNSTAYPAAHFCNDLVIDGYSDWYLPARYELDVIYFNLKPTTAANTGLVGTNPIAVPTRASNYPTTTPAINPAQTSAAAFQSGGAEAFDVAYYWASTRTASASWNATFQNGYGADGSRTNALRVRAIRRVPV